MLNDCFIGLGSNLGDKLRNLGNAAKLINDHPDCGIVSQSSIYETNPYGNVSQPGFLNTVIRIETRLDPEELLNLLKLIESEVGRKPSEHWGPREIDLDILLFNDISLIKDNLVIPHADLLNRDFFVKPILEIDAGISHPLNKIKLKDLNFNSDNTYILRSFETNLLNIGE